MKEKWIKISKFIIITILVISFAIPTFATSLQEEESKKNELENQLQDAQGTLKELESLKSNTYAYVEELDNSLDDIKANISKLQQSANEKQQLINDNIALIEQKEIEIQEQYVSMQKRIRFMYENAKTGYIDMLLGSENLSDMLNKAEYMSKITQYDRDMLEKIKEIKAEIEKTKAQLEVEKAEIETLKQEQVARQNDIQTLTDEKNTQIEQYENEISLTKNLQKELQAEIADQEEIIAAIKSSVDEGSGGYSNGLLLWPVANNYKITSDFGYRVHPIFGYNEYHDGIDIKASTGTPIRAAYSGKVTISKLSSSAGNYIVIYHGNNLYTEYMHCNERYVSVGDTVTAGQTIGTVGSTGWSTGAHLHFSVNIQTGSYFRTSDRVNPHPYLGQ